MSGKKEGCTENKEILIEEKLEREVRRIWNYPKGKSVSRAKAEAIAYLLTNAPVKVEPEEWFADQLIHCDIMQQYRDERCRNVYDACEVQGWNGRKSGLVGAYDASMDFGHIAPDWSIVMGRGFAGILDDLYCRRSLVAQGSAEYEFYTDCIIVYEAIKVFLIRLAECCEACGTQRTLFAAENLRHLAKAAPKTLAQAMQLTLLYYHLQMNLDCVIVRSLGGLDRLYAPFYRADLTAGRLDEQKARVLLEAFLLKCNAIKAVANLPFYICGRTAEGNDATNEFTKLLLEVYRELDLYDPKLHVMYHPEMNREVLDLLLEMIREGKNSFVFINCEVASRALIKIGIEPEDADRVIVYGCYETAAEGTEIPCTCAGRINMAKAAELAMNDGWDPLSEQQVGAHTGTDFKDFAEFAEAVKEQLRYLTDCCIRDLTEVDASMGQAWPSVMMSATFRSCMEKGAEAYAGGAKYNNTSVVGAGIATLVDSVLAVKKLVFEEQKISFEQLRNCLLQDWEGFEELRQVVLREKCKYGNHAAEADRLTAELFDTFADQINGRPNGRGGVFRCGLFSVDWRHWMGKRTGATADGRRQSESLSKNAAAVLGQDRCGVTAYLLSLQQLDGTRIPDGTVADVVLHRSAVHGREGMDAFRGLLLAYMNQGGFAVHFNVLDPEILRKAQKDPASYRNLQIRLCGWNVHFVDLSKEIQDEFILKSAAAQ